MARWRWRLALLLVLVLVLVTGTAALAQAPVFFGLQPGQSSRAQVELILGLPLSAQPGESQAFEYRPPAAAADVERVVAHYFPDDRLLARIDVHLRAPLSAESLRQRFGSLVMTRSRADGGREELFYPGLQALMLGSGAESVAAIGFLSPRWLADRYCDQFNERIAANDLDGAALLADKAVLVAPRYARSHLALGVLQDKAGRHAEALQLYLRAGEQPDGRHARARAWSYAGELGWRRLERPDAEVDGYFAKALALAPDFADAQWRYGQYLLARKRYPDAKRWLHSAFQLQRNLVKDWRDRADRLFDDRDYAGADAHFWILVEWLLDKRAGDTKLTERTHAMFRRAYSLEQLPRKEAARDAYLLLLKTDPTHLGGHNNVAVMYWDLGDLARAEEHFRQALTLDAGYFLAQRNLARLLLARQRPAEALPAAERALQLKADDAMAMIERARALAALGKKRDAIEWLEKAVAAGYADGKALATYAEFARLNKDKRFRKLLQRLNGGG